MKFFLSLTLAFIASFPLFAQVAGTSNPTIVSSNLSPVAPGFNNVFGPTFNQFSTNAVPANFGTGLATLQSDIQQLLPLLATVNDSVDFSAVTSSRQSSATNGTGSTAAVSAQNSIARTSTDFATILSSDASTRTAGAPAGGSFSTAISAPMQTAVVPSPTGVNNPLGLAPGFGGPITTNAFGAPVTARDVVRDLIVLQNDLERLLPVLVTLNASSLPPGFTNTVGQP